MMSLVLHGCRALYNSSEISAGFRRAPEAGRRTAWAQEAPRPPFIARVFKKDQTIRATPPTRARRRRAGRLPLHLM
jgi:hypothetical protein